MSQKEVTEGLLKLIQLEGRRIDSLYEMIKALKTVSDSMYESIQKIVGISSSKGDNDNEKIVLNCPHGLLNRNNCQWCANFGSKEPESTS